MQQAPIKRYDINYLHLVGEMFAPLKNESIAMLNAGPGKTFADVGCGTGIDVDRIGKTGATAIGFDHDPEVLEVARTTFAANGNCSFVRAEAWQLPLEDSSLDGIRYERMFQHVTNGEQIIEEAARVVKPGGLLEIVDKDYFSINLWMEDGKLERKLADWVSSGKRCVGAHDHRRLPAIMQKHGFALKTTKLYPIVCKDFEEADYIAKFSTLVDDMSEAGALTKEEADTCRQHFESARFAYAFYMVTMVAEKGK